MNNLPVQQRCHFWGLDSDTEQAQGLSITADKLAHAVDVGYGEENLGADDAAEIREAADGAGFHASYKK